LPGWSFRRRISAALLVPVCYVLYRLTSATTAERIDGRPAVTEPLVRRDGAVHANRIRRIDPKGIVTTFAGTGGESPDGMDVPHPGQLRIGPDGALYADDAYGRLLRFDLETGMLRVVAGGPDGILLE
jgi:hypothetical protein